MRTALCMLLLTLAAPALAAPPEDDPGQATLGGMSISLGGGSGDFVARDLRRLAAASRVWDLRVGFGERNPLAFEADYVAGEHSMEVFGLSSRALLVTVGLAGTVRLGVNHGRARPYVFAGLGWTRASLASMPLSMVGTTSYDDLLSVPLGAGVALRRGQWLVDLRASYYLATYEDLVLVGVNGIGEPLDLDSWTVSVHGGITFY